MNATNGMLCWNPRTDEVAVVPWPDYMRRSDKYQMTALAPHSHVQKLTLEQRKALCFIEAMHLIVRDKCDPMAVHQAMKNLDEYIAGCSEDMP